MTKNKDMLKRIELKVDSYRKLVNPYGKKELNSNIEIYILLVEATEVPDGISLETNPRGQNMRTKVAKRIREGLRDDNNAFYIFNRGILISAKEVTFNNKNSIAVIDMGDNPVLYGIVDGGHTYRTIIDNKDFLIQKDNKQYVKIEILTGIEAIFQDVADSRNTSVQVSDKAIAELNKRFNPIIKDAIKGQPYKDRIAYKENDEAPVDITDLIAILYMFNIDRFKQTDNVPVQSYSAKASTLKDYLDNYDNHENNMVNNPYFKMKKIIPDILKLVDTIELTMSNKYREKVPGGKFGSVRGIDPIQNGTTTYFERNTNYRISKGLIYPIIGAFRALVEENEPGQYIWTSDPFDMWDKIGASLVEDTIGRSRSFNNNPNAAGKDSGLWKQNYQTVFTQYILEEYAKAKHNK